MTKVLYIYAGVDRRELEKKVEACVSPDTSFFGFRHLKKAPGIEAEYLQLKKEIYGWGGAFFRRFAFTRALYVFLKYRRELLGYDALVIASSAYFHLALFKRWGLLKKQRLFLINLDLNIRFKKLEGHPWQKYWLKQSVAAAEKTICISEHQREFLVRLGFAPGKVVFVPLGVDKDFYQPIESTRELILTVGRDVGRDFETFIEAMSGLKERVVMICSPFNLKGLEERIPENMTVLYDQPYEVLKEYYRKAKLFVLATKPGESLVGSDCPGQTSVLDTLAYGMPLVATHSPWFEGYFEPGEHLVVVPPKDPQALREAVRNVSQNPALIERLSHEGRKLIEERCNSEAMGRAIARLVSESV